MARKVPPPIQPPDVNHLGSRPEQGSDYRPGEAYRSVPNGEEHDDHVSPLPPPSPLSASYGRYGAIPRSAYQRSPPSPNEVHYRRQRQMDSSNVEESRDTATSSSTTFDFSSFVPNLCTVTGPGSPEVTALEGQELYLHFFHEQLRSAQLGEYAAQEEARLSEYHMSEAHFHDQDVDGSTFSQRRRRRTQSMNLENFQNPIWRETGRELQSLADTFANSTERILVRERAAQVDVSTIDKEKFFAMLKELFQGGRVTKERILVLFFFCSDIAILAVQSRISGLLAELTRWSLIFIREQVCAWVHQNGGWSAVLRSGLNLIQQAAVIGMCTAVITCCFIYIRKNMS